MDEAIQSSIWVTSPEFSGWLMKRGFHWRKLWKKRWVALHGTEIAYMERQPSGNNDSMTITTAEITSATSIDRDDLGGDPNGFALHINDGKSPTWYLRADDVREKKAWIMRLAHVHTIVRWLEEYEKVKVLGVGGTGIVHELKHKITQEAFAMKEMEIKNRAQMTMAMKEAEMVKDITENISHQCIMRIEKVFQVGSKFYLVFPLCTGGELYEHVIRRGHFTEMDAAFIIRDLIDALHTLHTNGILHLDIKPENILFDSMQDDARIRLTDFGLSRILTEDGEEEQKMPNMDELNERLQAFVESGQLQRERLRGTVGYMSPELILTGSYGTATDVWAAGVVLYILLCGRPPFQSKSNREVLERSAKGEYAKDSAEWQAMPDSAKDLIIQMLTVDHAKRITTLGILEHPWLVSFTGTSGPGHAAKEKKKKIAARRASMLADGGGVETEDEVSDMATPSPSLKAGSSATAVKPRVLTNAIRLLSNHVMDRRTDKAIQQFQRNMSKVKPGEGSDGSPLDLNESGGYGVLKTILLERTSEGDGLLPELMRQDGGAPTEADAMFNGVLNPQAKDNMKVAFDALGENGKLTREQFSHVLAHFGIEGAFSSNMLCNFIDQDGDGWISVEDVVTTQALIINRNEVFLRAVFRMYQESVWYPGQKMNQFQMKRGESTNRGSSRLDSEEIRGIMAQPTSNKLGGDVVEPPKFITAKHITAVFGKCGHSSTDGTKIFEALCCTLRVLNLQSVDDASVDMGDPTTLEAGRDRAESSARLTISTTDWKAITSKDISGKMNCEDFIKAAAIDDVLIHAILPRNRANMQTKVAGMIARARPSATDIAPMTPVKESTLERSLSDVVLDGLDEPEVDMGSVLVKEMSTALTPKKL